MKLEAYGNQAALIGRILFALCFLGFGYEKIVMFGFGGLTGYMAAQGLPVPGLFAFLADVIEVGGAVLILIGYQTRLVALGFAIYVIVAALIAHHDWSNLQNLSDFLKNLAIAGGALAFVAYGSGTTSVDRK